MNYIEALFEKKEALLRATKNFYLLAIKAGYKIEDLIKYDYESQEKNSLELIEKLYKQIIQSNLQFYHRTTAYPSQLY